MRGPNKFAAFLIRNNTMKDLSTIIPRTKEELLEITGIGK